MAQWMDTVGDEDLKVQFYFNQQHPHSDVMVFAHIISTKPIKTFVSSLHDVWFLDPPKEFHSQRFVLRDRGIVLEGQKLPRPGYAIPIPSSVVPHLSHLYLAILEYNYVMNSHTHREDWDKVCKQDVFYVQRCEDYDSPIYSQVYMQGFLKPTRSLCSIKNNPCIEITLEYMRNCFHPRLYALVSNPPYTAEQHENLMLKREVESLKKRVAQLEKDVHIEFDDVPPEEEE